MEAAEMSTTPIVGPSTEILKDLNLRLELLVSKGKSINVTDPQSDLEAKEFRVECKSYEKAVDLFCDGDITDLSERLTKLRKAKKELLLPMEVILTAVDNMRKPWEENERKAAEKEQAKYGNTVEIRPAIPSLQGVASRRMYRVAVEDEDAVLLAWMKAK